MIIVLIIAVLLAIFSFIMMKRYYTGDVETAPRKRAMYESLAALFSFLALLIFFLLMAEDISEHYNNR